MQQRRDDKGRFPPGVSGNPSGLCKDGTIPVQDAPVTEARELVSLVEKREAALDEIERVLLDAAPALMAKAIKRAESNDKVLVVLVESLLGKISNATRRPQLPGVPKDRDQLELELFKTMDEIGIRVTNNRSTPLPAPAGAAAENAGPPPADQPGGEIEPE
jgi:hypothetical protein